MSSSFWTVLEAWGRISVVKPKWSGEKSDCPVRRNLPKEANVGLRVYGHKGSGSSADKGMSCSSSDLLYPLQPYEKECF